MITTKTLHFTQPLYLRSGRMLEPFDIVYETYGELNENKDNVVLITHALTGSHHAAGIYPGDNKPGWWDKMIGANKPIDTNKYFVISTSILGSPFGSTSPLSLKYPQMIPYRLSFPVISISDMVKAQIALLSKLNIHKIHAVIGGSMGGMQALSLAVEYPNFAKKAFVISATHATSAHVIAVNKIMSESIIGDKEFDNGNYDLNVEHDFKGLKVARMLGFMQYLSNDTFSEKFGRAYVENEGFYELFGRYEVERYLQYNGESFVKNYDPMCYLYILKALSHFDISHGFYDLKDALSVIKSKLYLITFSGDHMFFPKESETIHALVPNSSYHKVSSEYGHDSFLVEVDKYGDYIAKSLGE